jgi:hypothetical protein
MSQEKQQVAYECKCGIILSIPYHESPNIAPSLGEYKKITEQLLELVIQHQNRECAWMFNERVKAGLKIKIEEHISLSINDRGQVIEKPFYVYKHTNI